LPDTIDIDPINTYAIKVHSIPSVTVTDQEFEANQHNEVSIPTPQGSLKVYMPFSNTRYDRSIQVLVSKPRSPYTINVQDINSTDKYLTDYYDITILTLPPISIDSVQIRQNHTTEVEIPQPGLISISSKIEVVGGIFKYENYQMSKIAELNDQLLKQTILLQPGKYYLIYRKKLATRSQETMAKFFAIQPGESQNLKLD
jgi:Ca-activated chloride channel family protein